MTSNDPDEIRRNIEQTRNDLSDNVNALSEKVTPSRIVDRRVQAAKSGMSSLRDRVMGSSAEDDGPGTVQNAKESVSDAASHVGDLASSAPDAVRQRTQGNPLAAGLIAFGVGWLLSSALPASEVEQRAAGQLKDSVQPLTEHVQQTAKDVAQNLQEPAQQALDEVKSAAGDATATVKDHAQSEAGDVKEHAQQVGS